MNSKRAAAIAGVMFYLKQEAQEREQEHLRTGSAGLRGGWSVHGRRAVARARQMVQRGRKRRCVRGALIERGHRAQSRRQAYRAIQAGKP